MRIWQFFRCEKCACALYYIRWFSQAYLDWVRSLCVPGTRSHNGWRVSTLLLYIARLSTSYQWETASKLRLITQPNSGRLSRMRRLPRVWTSVLFMGKSAEGTLESLCLSLYIRSATQYSAMSLWIKVYTLSAKDTREGLFLNKGHFWYLQGVPYLESFFRSSTVVDTFSHLIQMCLKLIQPKSSVRVKASRKKDEDSTNSSLTRVRSDSVSMSVGGTGQVETVEGLRWL